MNRFRSTIHGNPSELEYFARRKEFGLKETLDERRNIANLHRREFEVGRNCERGESLDEILDRNNERRI